MFRYGRSQYPHDSQYNRGDRIQSIPDAPLRRFVGIAGRHIADKRFWHGRSGPSVNRRRGHHLWRPGMLAVLPRIDGRLPVPSSEKTVATDRSLPLEDRTAPNHKGPSTHFHPAC